LLPVVVAIVAWYMLDTFKEEEMQKLSAIHAKLTSERTALEAEAKKFKGYEEVKKALEQDEFTLRTKIETIQKLIADRSSPPKILLTLATSIPKEVWLSELKLTDKEGSFKGYSMGFGQISDFMKNLNESAYFTDLNIKKTEQAKDEGGAEVAAFELTARRR
jgi:Tfp pilus assembly protein PilN